MPAIHDLHARVAAHAPADPTEAAHRQAMLALLAAGPACFQRDHWDPGHFTASAFVLPPEGGAVLLVHHRKLQRWLQPGGHVEPDDADILAAALREVAEETGLRDLEHVPAPGYLLDVDVHVIPARPGAPEHRHFDLRVLLQARDRGVVATEEVLGARWVPLDEVPAVHTDASVRRAVARIRALGR